MEFVKTNFKYLFILILLAGVMGVGYAVAWESRSGLEVNFLDVGQGDAIFIQAKNGNQVLLDGGPSKSVLAQLSKVMPFYDRSIDVLMLSHPHADHLAGLVEVLNRYKVGLVVEPCFKEGDAEYKEWERLISEKKITRICAQKGGKICLEEDACFDVLLPIGKVEGRNIHDAMLVARLTYGENSFLFAGDMQKNLESYLVGIESKLESDVLKIGHHGSDTSTSEIFLGYVSPKYAVISVGKDNKFGHPSEIILDRLNAFGVEFFRTDEIGLIKIKSDGENILVN